MKSVLSRSKAKMPIFKNHVYFSATSFVLNDVNVSGGDITYRNSRDRYWAKVDSVLAGKRELNPKTIDMPFMLLNCLY